jgi:cytoskeletal protein RodZ
MKEAGEYLKGIREEKGYSILEVSKSTKLSSSVLRALEEGSIDNIDPVYLKGFLRIYCRFLGVAWEDFLKEHPLPSSAKHSHKQPERPHEEKKVIKNKKLILIFVSAVAASLFIVLAVRGYIFIAKKISDISARRKAVAVEPKTPPKTVTKKPKAAPQPPALPKSAQSQRADVVSPPSVSKDISDRSQIPAPAVKDVKSKEITLVVQAQEDCYLSVKVDGKLLYQRQLLKTKTESWRAKDKIELSVGNAGGITLEVNGKRIPALGRRGQVIKNILITREGLKIP